MKTRKPKMTEAERVAIRDNAAFDNDVPTLTPEQAAELDAELAGLAAEVIAPAPETPKDAPQPSAPKIVRGVRKESDADIAARAARADEAAKEWSLVTGLAKQGLTRPEISKQTGISYSRLTFVLWHLKYEVNAIPGMPEYTKAKKDAAQARYEADVKARKASA